MTPAISIGVPVYNMERLLPEAVESALGQTYRDFELIVVDNASTDRSYEIASEYARRDSRVRVFRNDTNIGHLPNFNRCFDLARGTWLKFLCADDWLAPDCLERLMAAARPGPLVMNCAEEYTFPPGFPDDVKAPHLAYWRKHSRRLSDRFPGRTLIPADEFAALVAEDPTTHAALTACSSMIHRAGWERFGRFNPDLSHLNDWELCARIGIHTGVLNVDDAVTYYRIHGASLSDTLVSKRPFRSDVLCALVLRHEVVHGEHYGPVREAAERQHIDLRFELFDAARHARDAVDHYTQARGDTRAAEDWRDMQQRYPQLMSPPPGYYPQKIWRWLSRRVQPALAGQGISAGARRTE
jgi:glycosyltransferase involved in cell wall biosynthesis